MPLHFRGALVPILALARVPAGRDPRCAGRRCGVVHAAVLLGSGQVDGGRAEPRCRRAGAGARPAPSAGVRDLVGRIASVRALLALSRHDVEDGRRPVAAGRSSTSIQPTRPFRASPLMTLGFAYQRQGDRAAARAAYVEVIAISAASGNIINELMGSIGLGMIQEADNELGAAVATFRARRGPGGRPAVPRRRRGAPRAGPRALPVGRARPRATRRSAAWRSLA